MVSVIKASVALNVGFVGSAVSPVAGLLQTLTVPCRGGLWAFTVITLTTICSTLPLRQQEVK